MKPAPNNETFPDFIKRSYDNGLEWLVTTVWKNTIAVATSGFGKGVLMMAVASLLSAGIGFAFFGVAGQATFMYGLGVGVEFLTHGIGAVMLGVGGVMGSISELRNHRNNLAEAAANPSQTCVTELSSEQAKQCAIAPALDTDMPQQENTKQFCAAELKRRMHQAEQQPCR